MSRADRGRPLRRRAFIGLGLGAGAAGLAAAGGIAAFASRDRGSAAAEASPSTEPAGTPTPVPLPTATPLPTPTPLPRGGTMRLLAPASLNFDTFDALRSGEVSVAEVLGRTHSRLVEWSSYEPLTIGGDLAARWEQPDERTLLLTLDPKARWQNRPPVGGRPAVAADVVEHLTRFRELAGSVALPAAQRAADLGSIEDVSSPADGVVRIRTAQPDALLLGALAGRFALVQAPEAVEAFAAKWHELDPATVIGSGPFVFTGTGPGSALQFAPHVAGHRTPLVDAVQVVGGTRPVELFRGHAVDEAVTRDRRDAAALRADASGAYVELARFEDSPVISSWAIGSPPWNVPGLRRALSAALNRGLLAKQLFGGRAAPSGPVAPVFADFALPETELQRFAGYRADAEADAKEARQQWEAAGGPALGPVTIDFPSIFDPLYSASSVVTARLNEVLGPQFRASVETYTTISAKAAGGRYGSGSASLWFGWGPQFADPDPSRALASQYGGASSLATLWRIDERAAAAKALAREVLGNGPGEVVDWLVQRQEVFRRPVLHRAPPSPFWQGHLDWQAFIGA